MLDRPEKTSVLLANLQAAVPFEVELSSSLITRLRQQTESVAVKAKENVSKISYLGDEGGIVCHIQPEAEGNVLIVSLTHVRVARSLPFAAAVFDYQKHRTKKLRKQQAQS